MSTATSRRTVTTARRPGRALLGQLLRFGGVGVLSTLAYLLLFAALRGAVGSQAANLVALLTTAVANTAVNRRVTFGVTGAAGRWRHQAQGLVVFAIGLALTGGALAALHAVAGTGHPAAEVAVLVVANAVATITRFALLRRVFRASARARCRPS